MLQELLGQYIPNTSPEEFYISSIGILPIELINLGRELKLMNVDIAIIPETKRPKRVRGLYINI